MKRFKKIYIEITNVCNLSCEFCPVTKRKAEFMALSVFEKILNEIKPYTDYIYFHVKGEPLLHPELEDFLIMAEAYGFKVNLTTNGTLINKVSSILLNKKSLRQVNFSLHSFDANSLSITMEDYLKNIIDFTKTAADANIIVSYRLWNLDEDKKSIEKNANILTYIEKAFNLDYKIQEKLIDSRGLKISRNIYLNLASKFKWPDNSSEENNNTGFCHGLRDQTAILVDGTVVPCCLDGEGIIKLGNINLSSFETILISERSTAIFNGFSNRKIHEELCKKCDYRKRFNS